MPRIRKPRRQRRPRRGAHEEPQCHRAIPPGEGDETFIGICEELGLWRVRAHGFDSYGLLEPDVGLAPVLEAMLEAADDVEVDHPELADSLRALVRGFEEGD